jgi:hypothetical protein
MPTSPALAPNPLNDSASHDRVMDATSPTAAFASLARIPLVPESVLKRHGAYCAIDTRFRGAARLLQCLWLKDQGIPTASPTPKSRHADQ